MDHWIDFIVDDVQYSYDPEDDPLLLVACKHCGSDKEVYFTETNGEAVICYCTQCSAGFSMPLLCCPGAKEVVEPDSQESWLWCPGCSEQHFQFEVADWVKCQKCGGDPYKLYRLAHRPFDRSSVIYCATCEACYDDGGF